MDNEPEILSEDHKHLLETFRDRVTDGTTYLVFEHRTITSEHHVPDGVFSKSSDGWMYMADRDMEDYLKSDKAYAQGRHIVVKVHERGPMPKLTLNLGVIYPNKMHLACAYFFGYEPGHSFQAKSELEGK